MSPTAKAYWIAALACLVTGLTYGLASYPLLDPDEGRNAEVAREMAATNDYLVPRLNELPYIDKPVVFFAVAAASIEVFGRDELAVRLAPLLFTCLTLILVGWFAHRLYGKTAALVAAVACGTMPLTLAFARTVIFDSALTLFVTGSITTLFLAVENDGTPRHRWVAMGFACIAMGILTKGPIAIVLPTLVVVPYAMWRRRWRILLDPVAWLLLVAMILPWVAVVSREVPDFLEYVLVTETAGRFLTDELQRTGPVWYFLPIIFAGSLPWSLVLVAGWWEGRRERNATSRDNRVVFFLSWIIIPLLFFSLSQSKRPQYMVPLMIPIALLVAHVWTVTGERARGVRIASVPLLGIALLIALTPTVVPRLLDVTAGIASAIPRTAYVLAGATLTATIGSWFAPRRISAAVALYALPAAAIPISSMGLMQSIGDDRSTKMVAEQIQPVLQSTTEVITIDAYPLSLPFYLDRTFTLATTDGSELTSNYLERSMSRFRGRVDTPLRPRDWWLGALADCSRHRVFVTQSDNHDARGILRERLPLIVETRRIAVYGPCETEVLARRGPTSKGFATVTHATSVGTRD